MTPSENSTFAAFAAENSAFAAFAAGQKRTRAEISPTSQIISEGDASALKKAHPSAPSNASSEAAIPKVTIRVNSSIPPVQPKFKSSEVDPSNKAKKGVSTSSPNRSSSARDERGGSQSMRNTRDKRIHSHIPLRRERKKLRSESLPGMDLVFPRMGMHVVSYNIYKNTPLKTTLQGEDFRFYPGLLNIDSVDLPGVASRLMISSILPRDEESYCKDLCDNLDMAERRIVEGAQHASVAFGFARKLKQTIENLEGKLQELEGKLQELEGKLQESRSLNVKLQDRVKSLGANQVNLKAIESKYAILNNDYEKLNKQNSFLQNDIKQLELKLADETSVVQKLKSDRASIRSTAIREYRESKDC